MTSCSSSQHMRRSARLTSPPATKSLPSSHTASSVCAAAKAEAVLVPLVFYDDWKIICRCRNAHPGTPGGWERGRGRGRPEHILQKSPSRRPVSPHCTVFRPSTLQLAPVNFARLACHSIIPRDNLFPDAKLATRRRHLGHQTCFWISGALHISEHAKLGAVRHYRGRGGEGGGGGGGCQGMRTCSAAMRVLSACLASRLSAGKGPPMLRVSTVWNTSLAAPPRTLACCQSRAASTRARACASSVLRNRLQERLRQADGRCDQTGATRSQRRRPKHLLELALTQICAERGPPGSAALASTPAMRRGGANRRHRFLRIVQDEARATYSAVQQMKEGAEKCGTLEAMPECHNRAASMPHSLGDIRAVGTRFADAQAATLCS